MSSVVWNGETHPAAELFPMLDEADLASLAASIERNGLQEPIVLDGDGTLLDGRNRLRACELADVEPRFSVYGGDDAIGVIASRNLHRRNLTTGQKGVLAYRLLEDYGDELGSEGRKRDKVAQLVGVSGRLVGQIERIAKTDAKLLERIESGETAPSRAEQVIREKEAEARTVEREMRKREIDPSSLRCEMRHGDFTEVLADLSGVDAIITDPPYPKEFLPELRKLATWADEVLSDDGVLVVLIGQAWLPQVFDLMSGGRPYLWTMAANLDGPRSQQHVAKMMVTWKPVLVYGNPSKWGPDSVSSRASEASSKHLHKWGQSFDLFDRLVGRFTEPGDLVVDPFAGSGTTLQAARLHGCHSIGADLDEESVTTARERLDLSNLEHKAEPCLSPR